MGLLDAVGSLLGTNNSDAAIAAQQAGAANSNATMLDIYNQERADQAPWRAAGQAALGQMQDPSFQKSFTMQDFQQDPGYNFQMQQGKQALERAASAKGLQMSGATLKDLAGYSQGLANQDYEQAYSNFNNNNNLKFNRLATLAGFGQNANAANSAAGMNYGNNVAQTQMGLGNATAADLMGQAGMNAGMLNSLMQATGQAVGASAGKGGGGESPTMFCDERLKTDIKPVSKEDMAELKACLRAYRFRYKDAKHGQGDFIGVMAQDLEKSKLGRTLVFENEKGEKQIDVHRVLMLFLASMAEA
jgi:hypothetical protein